MNPLEVFDKEPCVRCPPVEFESHLNFHRQICNYIELRQQYLQIKENVLPFFVRRVEKLHSDICEIHSNCETDYEYRIFTENLVQFNELLSHILTHNRHGHV